jgi:hypothetical protein
MSAGLMAHLVHKLGLANVECRNKGKRNIG